MQPKDLDRMKRKFPEEFPLIQELVKIVIHITRNKSVLCLNDMNLTQKEWGICHMAHFYIERDKDCIRIVQSRISPISGTPECWDYEKTFSFPLSDPDCLDKIELHLHKFCRSRKLHYKYWY